MNSLAEELGKGPAEDWPEAKTAVRVPAAIGPKRQLGDLRGVAITLAGLGRLEWFNEPKDIPSAEKHFQRDLEISEAIGDVVGQVKMHSFLGGCALEKDDLEQAVAHYGRSLELADAPIDQYFASVGLMRCYQRQGGSEPLEATAKRLLELVEREGHSSTARTSCGRCWRVFRQRRGAMPYRGSGTPYNAKPPNGGVRMLRVFLSWLSNSRVLGLAGRLASDRELRLVERGNRGVADMGSCRHEIPIRSEQ